MSSPRSDESGSLTQKMNLRPGYVPASSIAYAAAFAETCLRVFSFLDGFEAGGCAVSVAATVLRPSGLGLFAPCFFGFNFSRPLSSSRIRTRAAFATSPCECAGMDSSALRKAWLTGPLPRGARFGFCSSEGIMASNSLDDRSGWNHFHNGRLVAEWFMSMALDPTLK